MSYRTPLAQWLLRQSLTLTEWRAFKAHLKAEWLMPEVMAAEDLDFHLCAWTRTNRSKRGC